MAGIEGTGSYGFWLDEDPEPTGIGGHTEVERYTPWWRRGATALRQVDLTDEPISPWGRFYGGGLRSASSWWSGGTAESEIYSKLRYASGRLDRMANVVINKGFRGKEESLRIGWASADQPKKNCLLSNDPESKTIWLNPDPVVGAKKPQDTERVVEALAGEVLLQESLRRTVARKSVEENEASKDKVAKMVWSAMECAVARGTILEEWAGFAGYLKRHAEASCCSKDELEEKVAEAPEPTVGLAAAMLAWNMQFPHDPVEIPSVYRRAIEEASKELSDTLPAEERFAASDRIAKTLRRILKEDSEDPKGGDEPPPPPGGEPPPPGGDREVPPGGRPSDEEDGDDPGDYPRVSPPIDEPIEPKKAGEKDVPKGGDEPGGLGCGFGCVPPPYTVVYSMKSGGSYAVNAYKERVKPLRSQINAVREALRFRNNDISMWERGCESGVLDPGSLPKLATGEEDPAIWERKTIIGQPKIAVGVLLDQSGSMVNTAGGSKTKVEAAKDVCITMIEALSSIHGIELMILGHTAQRAEQTYTFGLNNNNVRNMTVIRGGSRVTTPGVADVPPEITSAGRVSGLQIMEWVVRGKRDKESIIEARAMAENLDGYAMEYASERLQRDYPDYPEKVLFVVSDGAPSGTGYGGSKSHRHMADVCRVARNRGVHIYGIGIADAYTPTAGEQMYGKDQFVILHDVFSSIRVLTMFLRRLAVARR